MSDLANPGRIPIYDSDRISVWYYPRTRIIHHVMHAPVFGEVFRAALSAGAKAMKEHRSAKWLSDDRLNGALLPDDFEWVDKVWHAQAMDAGWKYWALLPPQAVVGKMNIRRHINLYKERGVTVEVFTDLDKAMSWLETQGRWARLGAPGQHLWRPGAPRAHNCGSRAGDNPHACARDSSSWQPPSSAAAAR